MYIQRNIEPKLTYLATKYPVIALVGPRQSGKTTLAKQAFPKHSYFSLEDPDTALRIMQDPRAFLESDYGAGIILDEFQNEPVLLSYIQGIVDAKYRPGYFILTGSHNFLMNQAITQSLAGRVGILTLLPLSCDELDRSSYLPEKAHEAIFAGGYPNIYVRKLVGEDFYGPYLTTYVERDVRQLINIVRLSDFQKFIRLCAGRIGQLLDYVSLADDCGISVPTVKAWLSILEASYVIFLLQPHFKNFSKRMVKSPKLYFYDTGLACYLLKITSPDQLTLHYLYGGLFESFVIADICKTFFNKGQQPSVYFWRDSRGKEIDCLLDYGSRFVPIEIKSTQTFNSRFFEGIAYYRELAGAEVAQSAIVYAGKGDHKLSDRALLNWAEASTKLVE
jgi:predicted AAA+ superfamily ATPase